MSSRVLSGFDRRRSEFECLGDKDSKWYGRLVSASNIAVSGTETEFFKQVGFSERFIFWTYKDEMNFCFVSK